jgi:hypothetical protein
MPCGLGALTVRYPGSASWIRRDNLTRECLLSTVCSRIHRAPCTLNSGCRMWCHSRGGTFKMPFCPSFPARIPLTWRSGLRAYVHGTNSQIFNDHAARSEFAPHPFTAQCALPTLCVGGTGKPVTVVARSRLAACSSVDPLPTLLAVSQGGGLGASEGGATPLLISST